MKYRIKETFVVLFGNVADKVAIVVPNDSKTLWRAETFELAAKPRLRAVGLVGGDVMLLMPRKRAEKGLFLGSYLPTLLKEDL